MYFKLLPYALCFVGKKLNQSQLLSIFKSIDNQFQIANILIKEKLLNATISSGEEYVTLTAHFEPLDFNSMTAFIKSKTDGVCFFRIFFSIF